MTSFINMRHLSINNPLYNRGRSTIIYNHVEQTILTLHVYVVYIDS